MREIKFRAWSKRDAMMMGIYDIVYCVGGVRVSGTGVYMGNGWAERRDPSKRCDVVLMQYTGLKDKNGVEIYEGDGLRQYHDDGETMYAGFVEWWSEGDWLGWAINSQGSPDMLREEDAECLEVIGNIHESPELIGG